MFVVVVFFKRMYDKTLDFKFASYSHNQGLGQCYHYQPQPLDRLTTLYSTLTTPDITKTSSNREDKSDVTLRW